MAAGGAYLFVAHPVYQSDSLLRIKQQKGLGDSILASLPADNATGDKQRMMTDAEILKSRNVVLPVIEATEEPGKDGKLPTYENYVKGHITTKPYKDTEILQVSVTGKSPEQAQQANAMLVQGFIQRLTDLSHEEQKDTREFLEQRLADAKDELGKAEDALQAYQAENKMYSTDDQMKQLTDKLNIVDKAKAENQLNLETAQAGLSSVNEQLSSAGVSIADSPAIQTLITTYNDVTGENKKPFTMGGGTYARHFPYAVSFGPEHTDIELPEFAGPMHGANEGTPFEKLIEALKIYILALLRLQEIEL